MVKNKSVKKKTEKKKSVKKTSRADVDKLLIDNFITLQKVLTNLSVKFDGLTEQISKLLSLFEISAKSFSEKQGSSISGEDKAFLEKLDKLMEQNKIIAKGLSLMGERGGNREMGAQSPPSHPYQQSRRPMRR